jgi:hypothetical protein
MAASTLEYTPRSQFLPFHNRRERWASLNTHRRAGKTVALVNDVIVGALQCPLRKPQLAYVGPTFTQAKRIAWTYLKDYAEPYMSKPPSESELKVTLHGDRTIYCLGADNPDSLRGMYLDGGVGDEYALFRPSTFSTIIRPALSDRNGWWVFASTPKGKNLFYKTHRQSETDKDWFSLTLKASESGILPHSELDALRRDMDPEEFAQEYECSFDAALKGAIYAEEVNQLFADRRVHKDLYDPDLPSHVVFDLGFTDATVAIWWQEHKDGTLRVVNVEATQGKDVFHHIDRITAFKGTNDLGEVWLPHDARAKNLQTGKSIMEQFLQNDIRPSIVPNHKVRDRIAATRQLFPRIYLEQETSDDLIEALKGYRREWDENLLMFKDAPKHDWCSDYADAFGYMAVVAAPRFKSTRTADMTARPKVESNVAWTMDVNLAHLFQDHEDTRKGQHRRIG